MYRVCARWMSPKCSYLSASDICCRRLARPNRDVAAQGWRVHHGVRGYASVPAARRQDWYELCVSYLSRDFEIGISLLRGSSWHQCHAVSTTSPDTSSAPRPCCSSGPQLKCMTLSKSRYITGSCVLNNTWYAHTKKCRTPELVELYGTNKREAISTLLDMVYSDGDSSPPPFFAVCAT